MNEDKCTLCGCTFGLLQTKVLVHKAVKTKGEPCMYKLVGYRCDDGECEPEDNEDCPVLGKHCEHYCYQYDSNDEVAICFCSHPENTNEYEVIALKHFAQDY